MTRFRDAFPILYAEDAQRAVDFYVSTFGFELAFRWPEDGDLGFAYLRLDPLGIGISAQPGISENTGREFELCVYADDVDAAAERLRASGAEEVMPPRNEPWRERRTYFRDPDGHLLHVCAPLPPPGE